MGKRWKPRINKSEPRGEDRNPRENDHGNGAENVSKWLHVEIVGMGTLQWVYSSPKPKA